MRAPPPKGEKTCLPPIRTIMQNSTPIGVTVAEISVTKQIRTYVHTITANDIADKSHRLLALRLSIVKVSRSHFLQWSNDRRKGTDSSHGNTS